MARIVVIGSVALDEVVRLAEPLRPGAHLESLQTRTRLGGGGANVAIPLARSGHQVRLVSCVGRDGIGQRLLAELAEAGVDTSAVVQLPQPSTRSLVAIEPGGERTVINLHRCREKRPPLRIRRLSADLVYVRSRARDLTPLLAEKARSAMVIAHLPPCEPGSRPAQILVASESDLDRKQRMAFWPLARRVSGQLAQWAVLTLGSKGALACNGEKTLRVPASRGPVVDTTGAGDAFAAGLVHAIASGAAMRDALAIACAWGAACVRFDSSVLPARAMPRLNRSGGRMKTDGRSR